MAWIYLLFAGLFEIVWATSMKLSDGFSKPLYTVITLVAMVVSFGLLSFSMKTLPLGTAYTIWTGIGAIGAFVVGMIWMGDSVSWMRFFAAGLIVSGLVLMKTSS